MILPSVRQTRFKKKKMSSNEQLNALRERNKDLLNQLKQQREKLERLSGCSQSNKRGSEEDNEGDNEGDGTPASILTLTGDRGAARAALAKPTVRFADTREGPTGTRHTTPNPSLTSKHREGSAGHASDVVPDSDRHRGGQSRLQHTRPASTKSCLLNHSKEERESQSRAAFQAGEYDELPATDGHRLRPLLGYDWIAGVLESEDSLIERSDEFFSDLHTFRSLNKDECHHSPQAEFFEKNHACLPLLTDKEDQETNMDPHKCTFSYRINSRLFPVPLHSQECCPVCKKHKSSHPHTATEPALIRVSIPRSALLPPFKHKAHRRCSFDPSDSLGLPSHCLSGWSNNGPSMPPPPSSLDLRSSLNMKNSAGSEKKELEALSVPIVSGDQISDEVSVSRLARHNFQHFSPKRKLRSSSYPLQ